MSTVAQVASVVEWIGTWIVDPISDAINAVPPFEFWGIFPPEIASIVRTTLLCALIPLFALGVMGVAVFFGKPKEDDDEETLEGTVISVTPPGGFGAPAVGSQYNFRIRKPKKT